MNYIYPDFELSTVLGKSAKPFTMRTTFVPEDDVITKSKDLLRQKKSNTKTK